jgi:hypothetical protein
MKSVPSLLGRFEIPENALVVTTVPDSEMSANRKLSIALIDLVLSGASPAAHSS